MLTSEKMREIRKKALAAVADMPDGELKTKAFEIFLQKLLDHETSSVTEHIMKRPKENEKHERKKIKAITVKSRILLLKDENFFTIPRTLKDVREELKAHGWIHSSHVLSKPLLGLVRERHLRRIKEKVWKYVNL
jgi:hypothetical protein